MTATITKEKATTKPIEIDICSKAAEVAQKLGEKVNNELVGDKRDRLQVISSTHKYNGNDLHISYESLEIVSRVKEVADKAEHVMGNGDIKITYKGQNVFDAHVVWNSLSARVSTFVKYPVWQRKLEEVYQNISSLQPLEA